MPGAAQGDAQAEHPCRLHFRLWLCETVKLEQYLKRYSESECYDVCMIELFDEASLEKEIGLACTFHRKLICKKASEFKAVQGAFCHLLNAAEASNHKDALEQRGILSLHDLRYLAKHYNDF